MEENIVNQSALEQPETTENMIDVSEVNETELNAQIAEENELTVNSELDKQPEITITDNQTTNSEIIEQSETGISEEEIPFSDLGEQPEINVSDDQLPKAELNEEPIINEPLAVSVDISAIEENLAPQLMEEAYEDAQIENSAQKIDYSALSKQELIQILEKSLANLKAENVNNIEFKKADLVLKEIKPFFDIVKETEKKAALERFLSENESEEGFEYKESDEIQSFDQLYKKIKEAKFQYFSQQEKNKEKNFTVKTELLNQLRALADSEDGNITTVKANIATLKKLQQEWKDAGNLAGPHNNTLWQTYHALVDRFYSNRGIYFELLELDRKKNLNLKVELCTKVEAIAEKLKEEELSNKTFTEATHLFEEFKHIGPAAKDANELLWQRFKAALDVIYDKRRSQIDALQGTFEENLKAKLQIIESLALFTSFKSESINEWMEQTKAIDILQKQWDAIKGPLPKEKTREVNKEFWQGVKLFYKNKSDFFKALEAKRDENLKLKQSLCEQAETYLATEEDSPEITKAVIKLQEDWRKIGHVPDKFRNKIYERFKAACDAYFNKKRAKSNESDKEFQDNLLKKIALCEKIEKEATTEANLDKLPDIKKEWAVIGFVPKAEMQEIQKRYINAINSYVGALGKLTDKEKEKITLQTEVEIFKQKDKGSSKDLGRKESDIRVKIQNLENDLSTLKNNLEFFARSKNAEKLKADFEQKIKKGEDDLAHMKHQLKVVRQAAD